MPPQTHRRIVVAGGSLAGYSAVSELSALGFEGEVVWITGERGGAYSKPALSKEFIQGKSEIADVMLPQIKTRGLKLEIRHDERCETLDAGNRSIGLVSGKSVQFDGLLICTGARARSIAAAEGVAGVFPLRTLDDALAIRKQLAARPSVVILGGGLIGCELAASARGLGLDVTLVEQLNGLMMRPFGGALSDFFARLHAENGVKVLTGITTDRLVSRNGRVAEVHLADGSELPADLVVVGVGSTPETRWLEGSGLAIADGVLCDSRLRTSIDGIFAAGDVTRWFNPLFAAEMRVEHWSNASTQGRVAARNLAAWLRGAAGTSFAEVPYFWSDQYGLKIQMVGWHEGHDRTEIQNAQNGPGSLVTYFRRNRLVAAAGINAARAIMGYRKQIDEEARATVPGS
jgi:3-phenylpropionate/trans-cinnamate dioxygenase ferredoxin reductase subunit